MCQWRRSSSPVASRANVEASTGQETMCGVAGLIGWWQPGQVYVLVEADPVRRRTTKSRPS
ncbi:hypothetical protein NOCA2310123 [metagenome]|uniref:Uncharacterized protein n=1 Tax=metagenome TaxID=256318 RepID=A0A2P2C1Z5_9ZZZZ